jgi:putative DNA primase/helicase
MQRAWVDGSLGHASRPKHENQERHILANNDRDRFIAEALKYASLGWSVYPIQAAIDGRCTCRKGSDCESPGKHPHFDLGGFKVASKNSAELEKLFATDDATIGLLCDRFFVLDIDGEEGIADLNRLMEQHGDLPRTPTSITGGGGRHYLFNADGRVRSLTRIGGLSIDTKAGKTSAIVAPPSCHISGGEYRWLIDPVDVLLATAPRWLIDFVTQRGIANGTRFVVPESLDLASHPGANNGTRNDTLCRLVGSHLARFGPTPDLLIRATEWAGRCHPPFPLSSVQTTVTGLVARHQTHQPSAANQSSASSRPALPELSIKPFSEIEAKPVNWVWEGRIAAGKITLLTGEGGVGKSILTCDVASRISRGAAFCDGCPCVLGDVFFVTGEDGAEDTIRPRLDAAGADVMRVHLMRGPVLPEEKHASPFDLSRHMVLLDDALAKYPEAKLIVIDPIMDYLGQDTNSDKATDVRQILSPLRELAERYGVAIIAINHLNKSSRSPKSRSLGSGAFVHVARVELRVCEDPASPDRRLLLPVKNNLASPPGLAYRITGNRQGAGYAEWELGTVDISILDVEGDSNNDTSALSEAMDWLQTMVANGRVGAATLKAQAKCDGIAEVTLNRAKKELKIKPYRADDAWWWELPGSAQSQGSETPEADSSLPKSGIAETGVFSF